MAILNIGSLNIDHVYRVAHLVRPGETLSAEGLEVKPGGKGANQSAAIAKAGERVKHAGKVGQDGIFLVDALADAGVDVSLVNVADEPSGHAFIQVDDEGQNSIIIYGGGNQNLTREDIDGYLSVSVKTDTVLLQNETSNVAYAIQAAHERGLHVCLNPAPITDEVANYPLDLVSTLIVNEVEAAGLAGDGTRPAVILENLATRYPNAAIIMTLGGKGVLAAEGQQRLKLEAQNVNVVDTTAAGDTFVGYYVSQRSAGADLKSALDIANRAAAIAVSRPGAMPSIPSLLGVIQGSA